MSINIIKSLFAILVCASFQAQTTERTCDCPKTQYAGTKADSIFFLHGEKSIVLCGYKNKNNVPVTYSEFILSVCGQENIIDFWDAMQTCQLKVNHDTLLVEELKFLPSGEYFSFQPTVWIIEKIYFVNEKLVRRVEVNRKIRKYTTKEIQQVLIAFNTAAKGLDDSKMELANKLFIASISDNKKARKYLKDFEHKFGTLDGAFAEEYEDLVGMLELWDKKGIVK